MTPILHHARQAILIASLLGSTSLAQAEPGPANAAQPAQLSMAAELTDSYTTCYFNNNGSITWKWGLTASNGWYKFKGTWIKTKYTNGINKFSTTTSYSEIYQSCVNSQAYYNVSGNLFAIFTALSNTGDNYPIVVGGGELYPLY